MHPRRLYAHRGASAERPENTMLAFERAVEVGANALELDVHLTHDGQLIVAHDDTAARACGPNLPWADLELAEVHELDAGWGFVAADGSRPYAGQGVRVATAEEVLVRFPDVVINMDLKVPETVTPAIELVRRLGAEDRVTLASFHLGTLVAARRAGYKGATGLSQPELASLVALPALLWRQLPYTGTAAQVPTNHLKIHFDRAAFIAKCHSVGLRVDFWTIDDPTEAARLLDLGADGIMTNNPAALSGLFD